jgi:hypothetical protein
MSHPLVLHQRDNDRLLETLVRLRDLGNTVLVVEHDEDASVQPTILLILVLVLVFMAISLLKEPMMNLQPMRTLTGKYIW